jgi:hypothetical protein
MKVGVIRNQRAAFFYVQRSEREDGKGENLVLLRESCKYVGDKSGLYGQIGA